MPFNKYIRTSEHYKYVRLYHIGGDINKPGWFAQIGNLHRKCASEREAAILVDKALIFQGKKPLNILKKI